MHPNTLEFIFKHVPSIQKTLVQLTTEEIRRIIGSLSDVKAFLAKLDTEILNVLLFKVPEIKDISLNNTTAKIASTSNTTVAPVIEPEYQGLLFTKEELKKIRSVFPRVNELLSKLSERRQVALHALFPNVAKAILKLDSKDLEILNNNVAEIGDQLNNLNAESLVKIMADESDSNVLRKILC
ncbi:hypothetical protein ACTXT7_004469 [Hymenolepis weldensis]